MILITGGTGNIGRELIQALHAKGADFRVIVRKEESRKELKARGFNAVIGDFTRPKTWPAALAGVKQVFLLTVPDPEVVNMEGHFIQVASKAGTRKIVRVSAMGANPWSASPLLRLHGQCEAQLESSGLDWTLLRPTMFMQNIVPMYGDSVARTSTLYAPAGEARIPFVDTRDIASLAANVLTTEGHAGLVYEITGAESLTYAGLAEAISAQVGRGVKYVNVPDEVAYQSMIDMGTSGWFAHAIIGLFHLFRANGTTAVAQGTVARLTGQQPRTLGEYIRENLPAFQGGQTEKDMAMARRHLR